MKEFVCRICGEKLDGAYQLQKHRKTVHPDKIRGVGKSIKPQSAVDMILDAQKQIKEALSLITQEQAQLHDRMCILNDMEAKYKKLL